MTVTGLLPPLLFGKIACGEVRRRLVLHLCLICLLAHLSSISTPVTLLLQVAYFYHLPQSPRVSNIQLHIQGVVILPQQPIVSVVFLWLKLGYTGQNFKKDLVLV